MDTTWGSVPKLTGTLLDNEGFLKLHLGHCIGHPGRSPIASTIAPAPNHISGPAATFFLMIFKLGSPWDTPSVLQVMHGKFRHHEGAGCYVFPAENPTKLFPSSFLLKHCLPVAWQLPPLSFSPCSRGAKSKYAQCFGDKPPFLHCFPTSPAPFCILHS